MKIASWNVNSIKMRLPHVLEWLKIHEPDALLLQEIKCETEAFPSLEFSAIGYQAAVHGQKAYNGVAILTKKPVEVISKALDATDEQARFLHVVLEGVHLLNLYAPNGNPVETEKFTYKLRWLAQLHDYFEKLLTQEITFVAGGDYNIIPTAADVHDPALWAEDALFRPESRALWRRFHHLGLTDAFRALHPNTTHAYTFWDYQAGAWQRDAGIRIDHFLLSPQAADRVLSCSIDKTPRGAEKASDHTPIIVTLD